MENKKEHALYDALSDLDGLKSELDDLVHLLTMHDENLFKDMDPLRKGESWGGKYLMDRWPLHSSTLNVIRLRLYDILEEMQTGIKKGYDALGIQS